MTPHAATVRPWLATRTRTVGDRIVLEACGEIDIDTEERLRQALRAALDRSTTGVDLDLGAVGFCDCSGLNVLLHARQHALTLGKTLTFQATGPAIENLLGLAGTRHFFPDSPRVRRQGHDHAGNAISASRAPRNGSQDTTRTLRIEVEQLRRAMTTRPTIDLARGILMASYRLSPESAWRVLVNVSQHTNIKLRHVAEDVVGSLDGHPLSEETRRHLAAAVATEQDTSHPLPRAGAGRGRAPTTTQRRPVRGGLRPDTDSGSPARSARGPGTEPTSVESRRTPRTRYGEPDAAARHVRRADLAASVRP
jgi:anti-anti-sigma factor